MSNFSNFNFGTASRSKSSSITSSSTLMDLNDITGTNTVLIQGDNPATGEFGLHNDGTAVVTRWGDKALCTLRISMDEDHPVVLTFGPSIVPDKILTVSVNGFHRWETATVQISSSGNTITIDRNNAIGSIVDLELFFISDGWDEFNASELFYDSSGNSLTSSTVQGAINELILPQNLVEFNVEMISADRTLLPSENVYQYLTTTTPNLLVNPPANPVNGTHFIIKNSPNSSESFITNDVILEPGDIYEVKYNGIVWIEL